MLNMLSSIEEKIYQRSLDLPCKIAIKSGKNAVTYKDLWDRILGAKQYFESLEDLKEDDVAILAAGKQIEFVFAYFGAHLAGLRVAPIDPTTNPTRLSHIINQTHPALLIGFDNTEIEGLRKISINTFSNLSCNNISCDFPDINRVADILFTTGTTGDPKGVALSYKNEAAAARNINTFIGNKTDDIELLALPISHSFGLGRLRCCLSIGSTIILAGNLANISKIFRSFEMDGVTGFSMVPASYRYLQKYCGSQLSQHLNRLRYIEMGSASLSEEEKRELANKLPNTKICMHYGLTEASRSAFIEFHNDNEFLKSVGKASPYTTIRIIDENGVECANGIEGEICIKGEHVMNGYLNKDNTESFFGEFFRTGDLGFLDEQGYIYLKSRKDEIINTGGKKVSPQEVEEQILKIEGIEDCACIGIPDKNEILGSVIKAFIVNPEGKQITTEKINDFLIERLETYKIPSLYEWIDEIPKTSNGKVQRNLLK